MNGWSDERMDKELMDGQMNDVRRKSITRPAERFTDTDDNASGYQLIKCSTRWFGIQYAEEKLSCNCSSLHF